MRINSLKKIKVSKKIETPVNNLDNQKQMGETLFELSKVFNSISNNTNK